MKDWADELDAGRKHTTGGASSIDIGAVRGALDMYEAAKASPRWNDHEFQTAFDGDASTYSGHVLDGDGRAEA